MLRISLLFMLLVTFSNSTPSESAVVQDLSLAQMTERAHWIVRGTINGKHARWLETDRPGIFTQLELRLLEVLKGPAKPGEVMTFEQFGGTVDGITHMIPGSPQFDVGEEVLLFLNRHRSGRLYIVGFSQGKFKVSRTPHSAQVSRDLVATHRVGTVAHPAQQFSEGVDELNALRRAIRSLLTAKEYGADQ